MCYVFLMLSAVPSGPPTSVSATSTSTTIDVQWGEVDCIHRNGDITGYSVQYGVQGSENRETVSVLGEEATNRRIFGLNSSTNYTVQVAAENLVGLGMYSDPPLIILTDSKWHHNDTLQ